MLTPFDWSHCVLGIRNLLLVLDEPVKVPHFLLAHLLQRIEVLSVIEVCECYLLFVSVTWLRRRTLVIRILLIYMRNLRPRNERIIHRNSKIRGRNMLQSPPLIKIRRGPNIPDSILIIPQTWIHNIGRGLSDTWVFILFQIFVLISGPIVEIVFILNRLVKLFDAYSAIMGLLVVLAELINLFFNRIDWFFTT